MRPQDLQVEHLQIIAKRCGLPVDDLTGARSQYYTLYRNRDLHWVGPEMERLHAKFIALRLKRSAL